MWWDQSLESVFPISMGFLPCSTVQIRDCRIWPKDLRSRSLVSYLGLRVAIFQNLLQAEKENGINTIGRENKTASLARSNTDDPNLLLLPGHRVASLVCGTSGCPSNSTPSSSNTLQWLSTGIHPQYTRLQVQIVWPMLILLIFSLPYEPEAITMDISTLRECLVYTKQFTGVMITLWNATSIIL